MKIDQLKDKIREILKGIDETEDASVDGWWETSTGAERGADKLAQVMAAIDKVLGD